MNDHAPAGQLDVGTGFGRKAPTYLAALTGVGPRTPMGNLLRRYYRHQKVEARARHRLGITVALAPETTEERAHVDVEVGERLHAALDELPAGTRESVWLRMVDELSYDEIAARQGCSQSAVRKRVSRGMRTLAVVLEGTR